MSDSFRVTRPDLRAILEALVELEPIFHHPEQGGTRADFDRMTDVDFWETGASGRRYGREEIWAVLAQRYADGAPDRWTIDEPAVHQVAVDTYLMTYTLDQGDRITRRATIWQSRDARWVALYHQGTPVDRP